MKAPSVRVIGAAFSSLFLAITPAFAQGTAFTYQGQLQNNGSLAGGTYNLTFTLFATNSGGSAVAGPVTNSAIAVSNGLFTVTVDFGAGVWNGTTNWLEIAVETNGSGSFTTLSPRQRVTPTPYAITAENLYGTVAGGGLSGTYSNQITLSNAANQFNGAFTGNGSGLTGVWLTGGNSGTTAGPNFVGTTDNQPLELHINGLRALRLEPTTNASFVTNAVNVIGGSSANFAAPGIVGVTIAGGGAQIYFSESAPNLVQDNFGTIGGGVNNDIETNAYESTISGGNANSILAGAYRSSIAGGWANSSGSASSVIVGGEQNTISSNSIFSFIGGGDFNTVQGGSSNSVICGGLRNTAGGPYATVPGGVDNGASGSYSFAAGRGAQASHQGAFVWADSQSSFFGSSSNDQFCVRAQGGVRLDNSTSIYFGTQTRQMLNLYQSGYGIGVQNFTTYFRSSSDFCWFRGGVHSDAQSDPGFDGSRLMLLNSSGLTVNGTFVSACDRNAKQDFSPVSSAQILDKVAALPISQWSYKADAATRHIGPVAQDFYAAFHVGPDDKHIAVVDESGVALAAIQALNQKLETQLKEKDGEIQALKARLDRLETAMQNQK
jgi:hypothetical protein